MIAAIGILLKHSVNIFHIFKENFLLPKSKNGYTRHKIHRVCWSQQTRDCLSTERSFRDIWFYRKAKERSFQWIVCPDRRNLLEKGSSSKGENLRNRISLANPETGRGYLQQFLWVPPVREAWVAIRKFSGQPYKLLWFIPRSFWHRGLSFRLSVYLWGNPIRWAWELCRSCYNVIGAK